MNSALQNQKLLIVNADDLGYTSGVNRGIIKAFSDGIVTSASLMVNGCAVNEAVELTRSTPGLDLGLHFQISTEGISSILKAHVKLDLSTKDKILRELVQQIEKFESLTNAAPTHINSHHHLHLYTRLKPVLEEFSKKHRVAVRGLGGNKLLTSFYGRNKMRRVDLNKISLQNFEKIINNLEVGVNEVMCHPGFADAELVKASKYALEREVELKTLTSPSIKSTIQELDIKLMGWSEIGISKLLV